MCGRFKVKIFDSVFSQKYVGAQSLKSHVTHVHNHIGWVNKMCKLMPTSNTPDMRYMICIAFSLQALYVDTRLMGPIRSLDGADV